MATKKKSKMKPKKKSGKKAARKPVRKAAAKAPKKPAARKSAAKRGKSGGRANLSLRVDPSLTVNDIEASLAFYRDVVGFTLKERWEDNGKLMGVQMMAGKTSFMLGQDDWQKGRDRDKGAGVRFFCFTDQDVDSLAARIKGKGGTLTQEPKDEWGMRSFSLEDPDGYKITIGSMLK